MFALPIGTFIGFMAAFLAAIVVAFVSWRSLGERAVAADRVSQSLQIISQAQAVLSTAKDAETGQRGFLLTGAERYLEPYTAAQSRLPSLLQRLRELAGRGPRELQRVDALSATIDDKMTELGKTIELRRAGQTEAALDIVSNDRGKLAMDRIRSGVEDIVRDENRALDERQAEWQSTVQVSALLSVGGSAVLIFLIALAAAAAARDYRAQKTQAWVRNGQVGFARAIAGEQRLDAIAERVLAFLAEYLHAPVGALYVVDAAGHLRRYAAYALDAGAQTEMTDSAGNLLAQAARDKRPLRVDDVPEGYLPVTSALGRGAPRTLLVAPALADDVVQGAVELGFFRSVDGTDEELLARISEALGMAMRTGKDRQRVRGAARGNAAPGRGAADAAGGAAGQQRGARGAGPGAEGIAGAARVAAGRARADQRAARGAGRRCWSARSDELADAAGRARRARRRARALEPVQERVPRQHEPRAAHAAQLDADPGQAARRQQGQATSAPSR